VRRRRRRLQAQRSWIGPDREMLQIDRRQFVAEVVESLLESDERQRRLPYSRRGRQHGHASTPSDDRSMHEQQVRPQMLKGNRDVLVDMEEKIGSGIENGTAAFRSQVKDWLGAAVATNVVFARRPEGTGGSRDQATEGSLHEKGAFDVPTVDDELTATRGQREIAHETCRVTASLAAAAPSVTRIARTGTRSVVYRRVAGWLRIQAIADSIIALWLAVPSPSASAFRAARSLLREGRPGLEGKDCGDCIGCCFDERSPSQLVLGPPFCCHALHP
jgi:hypothetical protein